MNNVEEFKRRLLEDFNWAVANDRSGLKIIESDNGSFQVYRKDKTFCVCKYISFREFKTAYYLNYNNIELFDCSNLYWSVFGYVNKSRDQTIEKTPTDFMVMKYLNGPELI